MIIKEQNRRTARGIEIGSCYCAREQRLNPNRDCGTHTEIAAAIAQERERADSYRTVLRRYPEWHGGICVLLCSLIPHWHHPSCPRKTMPEILADQTWQETRPQHGAPGRE